MDVSKQEIEAVIKLSPEKRYTYFIKRICDWELIWTLYEDDSIILNEGKNGELYMILFPFIDFASYYVTKTKEMSGSLCKSFELEEFIHGPQNAFSDDIIFFILCDKENELEKIKSIKEFIRNEIGFCSVIGDSCFDDRDLCFKYMSKNFRSLEIITSFQVIAYCMARDRGRDLSRGVNVSVNKYIKKTL